jgi:hypothetical protein
MGCRRTLKVRGGGLLCPRVSGCFFTYINCVIYQDIPFKRKYLQLQNFRFGGLSKIEPKSSKIVGFKIYKGKIEEEKKWASLAKQKSEQLEPSNLSLLNGRRPPKKMDDDLNYLKKN